MNTKTSQQPLIMSTVEEGVSNIPALLYKAKCQRTFMTAQELWELLFEEEPSHGDLITLGLALTRAGYKRHGGGSVVRVDANTRQRYWQVQQQGITYKDRDVRADVLRHKEWIS